MWALSRCTKGRASFPCSALSLGGAGFTKLLFPSPLRAPATLFHSSQARAGANPNGPSTGLDVQLLDMGMWSLGLGAVGAAIAGILLANTDLCLPRVDKASADYLGDADLRSTTNEDEVIKASSLWQERGAVVMAVRRPG